MKVKFWLFAALFAAAGAFTACSNDDPGKEPGPDDKKPIPHMEINQWMDGNMRTLYLWNEEYKKLTLDFDQEYQNFLKSALDGVKKQNNANAEDGYYYGDQWIYYSYVEAKQKTRSTRADQTIDYGFGITGHNFGNVNGTIYMAVLGVIPGSPADKAGITRGSFISKINGTSITEQNALSLAKLLYPSAISADIVRLDWSEITAENGQFVVTPKQSGFNLKPATFSRNPILYATLALSETNPDVCIAYLVYHEFDMNYDETLMDWFKTFKQTAEKEGKKVTDLILDLRYNGGGYLFSSAMLATLITGEKHKGGLYVETTYNEERNKTMAPGQYFIGKKEVPEGEYPLIEEALKHSLDLDRVFVLTMNGTASASELIINGLRGLDVEVNTIGEYTNGKNVGMEVDTRTFGDYEVSFAPCTIRLKNAKGFGDYSSGLEPSLTVVNPDSDWLIAPYASNGDPLFRMAYEWIVTGKKPTLEANAGTRAADLGYYSFGEYHAAPGVSGAIMNGIAK